MYSTFIPARGSPAGWDILAELLATKWRRMDSLASGESFSGRYLLISKGLQAAWDERRLAFDVP
jgi:hypothetical protein